MTRQYSISEARNNLPNIVKDVEHGPSIELTRRGRPVAVLVSIDHFQRLNSKRHDLWTGIQDFRVGHNLSNLGIDEVYADIRDRSPGRSPRL